MSDVPEEWIGFLDIDDEVTVIKLDGALADPGPVSFGAPNERIFGLELAIAQDTADGLTGRVRFRDEELVLTGASDGNVWSGDIEWGARSGIFEARRVQLWDKAAYRALSSRYRFADRSISIHVNADEWVGTPVFFYSEKDRFVRIYPDALGNLISESAESFALSADRTSLESVRQLGRIGRDSEPVAVRRDPGWVDEEVTTTGPGGTLVGTLMKPLGPGPHAAVIIVHGAAGGERDYYRPFAEHYVNGGLAALVFDRRGWGASTGDSSPTFAEKADDAEAWLDYLQTRSDIRSDRIGVWGFSNGTWVAPLLAARRPDVAFVAVIGAAGTTALETEIHRRTFDLREQEVPEDQIAMVEEMWRLAYALIMSRNIDDEHASRYDGLAAIVHASEELKRIDLQEYAVQSPFLGPVPPYESYQELIEDMANQRVDNDEWSTDPVDSYRVINVPVLYMVGENDSNLPAMVSARRVSQALQAANNQDSIVVLFPNTGHAMNISHPGAVGMNDEEAGYRIHNYRFVGGFLDLVAWWSHRQASA